MKYTFTSSNTKVAAVNAKGTVTGKAAGTVTITVKTPATANYNEGSGTVEITVNKVLKKPGNCRFVKWNNSRHTSCRIAWNKVAGADGYQILLSGKDGSNESSTYVDSDVLYEDCTVSGNRVSRVKVRAYYMLNGERKFGPWSKTVRNDPSNTKHSKKNGGGFFARQGRCVLSGKNSRVGLIKSRENIFCKSWKLILQVVKTYSASRENLFRKS